MLLHLADILGVAGELARGEANVVKGVALLETPENEARAQRQLLGPRQALCGSLLSSGFKLPSQTPQATILDI